MEAGLPWNKASDVPAHLHDLHRDAKRPIFHPLAPKGWSSDPCGPIFYKGRYHLFYQHNHASCQWYWGLCHDHVVSDDLVHWKNLPPAVVPTPGGLDADACFSGTVELDPELGVPVILYTGVYLKANAEAVAAHGLPAPEYDPGTHFVETQLGAVPADPDDPDLTYWVKLPNPVIASPPPGLNISCWRDPFCMQRPAAAGGEGDEWVILLASGIRGVGGAVLRFKSKHFTHSWEFDGFLADGDNAALGIRGQDWECPIMAQLPQVTRADVAIRTAAAAATSALAAAAGVADNKKPYAPSSSNTRSVMSEAGSHTQNVMHGAAGSRNATYALSSSGGSSVSLVVADDATSVSSSSSSSSTAAPSSPGRSTPPASVVAGTAAAAGYPSVVTPDSLLALPLTEPALAATTTSAAAAAAAANSSSSGGDPSLLSHPAVNVDVWLKHQAETAAVPATGNVVAQVAQVQQQRKEKSVVPTDAVSVVSSASSSSSSSADLATLSSRCGSTGSHGFGSSNNNNSNTNSSKCWWFCMSPDACNNPITWWLGDYDGTRFDIATADGPHRLDLGTTLYAASLWQDPMGRQLLYGWIQEHRRVATPPALCADYSYAGCISTPRVLQLVGNQLWQTALPEIDTLRTSVSWHATDLLLPPCGRLLPLQVVGGTHLDINVTLLPPATTPAATNNAAAAAAAGAPSAPAAAADEAVEGRRAGLVFKSWRPCGKGAAVLSFNWDSCELLFDFDEPFPDAYDPHPEDTAERRRVGGKLKHYVQGEPLSLRILLDGSAVEVFTSTGETLTTRIYRGHPPKCACAGCPGTAAAAAGTGGPSADLESSAEELVVVQADEQEDEDETGIALFAAGVAVTVSQLDVWEMGSCWVPPSPAPPQPPALLQQRLAAAAVHTDPLVLAAAAAAEQSTPIANSVSSSSSLEDESEVEAAVHGLGPVAAPQPTAGGAGAGAGAGGSSKAGRPAAATALAAVDEMQPSTHQQHHDYQHHSAGGQATVTEHFLEDLHIHAK